MSYTHLTIEERACIAQFYHKGIKISEIATLIGRNKSTISRELRRNPSRDSGYNPVGAQRKYNKRRKHCRKQSKLAIHNARYEAVVEGLNRYWSPEEIANTLPSDCSISTASIYRALHKGLLPHILKTRLRRYGKQTKKKVKGIFYDFSSVRTISQRDPAVLERSTYGHWELDTVVLRSECGCYLATFVERKSRFLIIVRIENKKATTMSAAIIEAFKKLPKSIVKTLTVDRGLEFTDWRTVEQALDAKVYFCDPYMPSQRGTNENTNGLIRQFFPRRTLLPTVSHEFVAHVQDLINNRPRKILNWSTPAHDLLLHLD